MTGYCRNGSWPSRGQDNNLPTIYFSSSFSDRKKPAKNTPYIFMVCVVTLVSHIVQPPAQRRVSAEFRPYLLKALSNQIWKTSKIRGSSTSLCSLLQGLPLLTVKRLFLVSRWNLPCIIVLDSGEPSVSGAVSLCFSPRKIAFMGAAAEACSSVCGPHCCVFSKELDCPR